MTNTNEAPDLARVRRLARAAREASAMADVAQADFRDALREAHRRGAEIEELADAAGISPQRAYQLAGETRTRT